MTIFGPAAAKWRAAAFLAVLALAAAGLLSVRVHATKLVDRAKIAPEGTVGWTVPVPMPIFARVLGHASHDSNQSPARSKLVLIEDGRTLGPPHALHDDVRRLGQGRYSHWHTTLYFSTSDNSDPRANGRDYRVSYEWKLTPAIVFVPAAALALLPLWRLMAPLIAYVRGRSWRRVVVNAGLFAASCLFAFGLFEIGLRIVKPIEFRLQGNRINLARNQVITMENANYEKLDRTITHTKNELGFRGPNPPLLFDRHLTIVVVGGSATEGYYLSDGDTWPEVLGGRLSESFSPVWINNAGLDGHSSYGHARLIEDYIGKIRPKVVLFLVGINDIGLSSSNPYDDFYVRNALKPSDSGETAMQSILRALRGWRQFSTVAAEYSHVVNLALTVNRSLVASQRGLGHGQIDFSKIGPLSMSEAEKTADLADHRARFVPAYKERLRLLIQLTRAHGIHPILITQPTLWGYGIDPTTRADLGAASGFFWDRLQLYNQAAREIGDVEKVFVMDLAAEMPKDSRFYYDWMHFTREGAAKVAEIVRRRLIPILTDLYPSYARQR